MLLAELPQEDGNREKEVAEVCDDEDGRKYAVETRVRPQAVRNVGWDRDHEPGDEHPWDNPHTLGA